MSFKDKVVIVTGASSGIGAAVAVGFSSEGARVVMVGRNENKLASVAARCNEPLVVKADVGNDEDAKRIIDRTIDHFGQIDVLVNNAGIGAWGNLVSGKLVESYDTVMRVNLRAVVNLTSLATPHLIKTKGNVINISSIVGLLPSSVKSGLSMYAVSKAAINHFGACAAAELAEYGVRVNTVSPGPVVTDILETSKSPITWDDFKKMTALDRVSQPEEIADLVMFLASDKAKAITGSNHVSDNGLFVKRY
ncbi:3-dehydroecdysone 3alpha-reductase [Danaus plexippus plexippus]|uniref:3-dehydroecdysone 3alpha-reductase n=1 Tax=Danaus plexippus plexippus TaxID=278856 RepID=A0A212EJ84_DANPL|nr:3-dehydroecdysone 3alpha-reductase [Danaus plexippus plexippus]